MDTTVMATIHVGEPMAAMSFASSGTCAPAVVDFTNGSTGAIDFTWDFGDGMESNMIDPTHVYTEPGIYFTQLTVTDELGCQDSITAIDTIIVQGPVVDFLWMDSLACEHLEVAFSNQTIDGVTYEWHFGDGATSTLEDPTHLYTDPGVYDVTLIATDANGCSSSNSYTGIIEIFENPAISATFSDTMGCGPLTVSMTALGTGVAATSWDLGDGSTSTQDSLSHTYTTSGNYVIEIVGTTMNGCSDTLQQLIVVEQNFDASIDPAGPYCSTQVSDTLTAANAGGSWSGTGISAAGVFDPIAAGVGNHTITYTISGACGAMDSIEIVVNQGFSAQIDMVLPICSNVAPFQMTAADAGGTWSGIGVDPTTGLFDPAAAGAGSHTITYTISGICGDSDDFILDVLATPVADFNVNITSLCAPSMVDLNNQSTMAGNYEWYMDGSFVSASENPSLMVNPGVYDIMLVASNPWGCTDTAFVAGAIDLQDAGPLPSPEMVVTTVINNEVVYTKWSDTLAGHPNLNEYWLFRSEDQVNYDLVTTMSSSQHDYYDYDVDVMNQNYTYYVLAVNHCEVASEQGNISSSILLEGVQIDELTDRLYWTPYTEWEDGVDRYEIQILLENGVWETIEVVDGNTTFVDIQ